MTKRDYKRYLPVTKYGNLQVGLKRLSADRQIKKRVTEYAPRKGPHLMARKMLVIDDLTGIPIANESDAIPVTVIIRIPAGDQKQEGEKAPPAKPATRRPAAKPQSVETEYELEISEVTLRYLRALVSGNLSEFHAYSKAFVKSAASGGDNGDSEMIRKWARDKGIEIKDKGRVPSDIVSQYRQAMSKGIS